MGNFDHLFSFTLNISTKNIDSIAKFLPLEF
jgi:hypothetical protein